MKIKICNPANMDGEIHGIERYEVLSGISDLRRSEGNIFEEASVAFFDGTGGDPVEDKDEFYNASGRKRRAHRRKKRDEYHDRRLKLREKRTGIKSTQAQAQKEIAKSASQTDPTLITALNQQPTAKSSGKKGMSTGMKVAIGAGIIGVLAIAGYALYKSKH